MVWQSAGMWLSAALAACHPAHVEASRQVTWTHGRSSTFRAAFSQALEGSLFRLGGFRDRLRGMLHHRGPPTCFTHERGQPATSRRQRRTAVGT